MYQVYGTFSSYERGWFKINKALFKTKQEAENFIKRRQNVVLYATMKYKIKNTNTKEEHTVNIKHKSVKPTLPKGYKKYKAGMKIKHGDEIIVNMGNTELYQGVVNNPNDNIDGEQQVSFWSCDSGWKCLEYTTKRQIKGIKK